MMNNFNALFGEILCENTGGYGVGIFPGAFKPPHKGHFHTALNACKVNNEVHILLSSTSRQIESLLQNKQKDKSNVSACDSSRYDYFFNGRMGDLRLNIERADCARETSASLVRGSLHPATQDWTTIRESLPREIGDRDIQKVEGILSAASKKREIDLETSKGIWDIYLPHLARLSGRSPEDVKLTISPGSPVRETFELVEQLNKEANAESITVRLYVGV